MAVDEDYKKIVFQLRNLSGRFLRLLHLILELVAPKDPRSWAFLLESNVAWSGNYRAIAEAALEAGAARIVIVCGKVKRDQIKSIYRDDRRVSVVSYLSWKYARCKALFISHRPPLPILQLPRWLTGKHVILCWHGIGFKTIGYQSPLRKSKHERKLFLKYTSHLSGLIASSTHNKKRMMESFMVPEEVVWVTGYPRTDWLVTPENQLPKFLIRDIESLRKLLNNRKLILYAPTWEPLRQIPPETGDIPLTLPGIEETCAHLNKRFPECAIGFRMHSLAPPASEVMPKILNLSQPEWQHVEAVLRLADVLITDFSSIWVDYLLVGGGLVGYTPHLNTYRKYRGLADDYEDQFPGELCRDTTHLLESVYRALNYISPEGNVLSNQARYPYEIVSRYHQFPAGKASSRVVDRVVSQLKRNGQRGCP